MGVTWNANHIRSTSGETTVSDHISTTPAAPENTFQQRLGALLECTGVTYRQIERGTRGVVSQHHVWQYRSGRAKNPSYKTLAVLAHFFNIPASYFFGDTC